MADHKHEDPTLPGPYPAPGGTTVNDTLEGLGTLSERERLETEEPFFARVARGTAPPPLAQDSVIAETPMVRDDAVYDGSYPMSGTPLDARTPHAKDIHTQDLHHAQDVRRAQHEQDLYQGHQDEGLREMGHVAERGYAGDYLVGDHQASARPFDHTESAVDDLKSLPSHIADVGRDALVLVRKELRLAKAELTEKAVEMRDGATTAAIGGALAVGGALALIAGLIMILGLVIAYWASAVLVGAVATLAGLRMFKRGKRRLDPTHLTLSRTMHELSLDKQMIKERVQR